MIVQKQRKAMRRRRSSVAMPGKLSKAQLAAIFGKKADDNCAVRMESDHGDPIFILSGEGDFPFV